MKKEYDTYIYLISGQSSTSVWTSNQNCKSTTWVVAFKAQTITLVSGNIPMVKIERVEQP